MFSLRMRHPGVCKALAHLASYLTFGPKEITIRFAERELRPEKGGGSPKVTQRVSRTQVGHPGLRPLLASFPGCHTSLATPTPSSSAAPPLSCCGSVSSSVK